ncbi:MAG: DinB family protein, partial [Pyrinomonadaceae bacterium]
AYARWVNDSYWLLGPLKVLDPGVKLTYEGSKESEGVACENTFREFLTHLLLHSSIHRGNIILNLRASGMEPPKIDYIIYLRENQPRGNADLTQNSTVALPLLI